MRALASEEPHQLLTAPDAFETYLDISPLSVARLFQSVPSSWLEVIHAPLIRINDPAPMRIVMLLQKH